MTTVQEYPFDFQCSPEAVSGLEALALEDFSKVATEYSRTAGHRLLVTSARRTLRHTASLMADMSIEQLEGMYCRNGYPDYIQSMKEAIQKLGRKLTAEEAYEILKNRKEGYISAHLSGAAIDIAKEGLKDPELLTDLLKKHDFVTLDEESLGIRCIHASHSKIAKKIIRE